MTQTSDDTNDPNSLLPSQWTVTKALDCPERRLLRAVMVQALRDLTDSHTATRRKAEAWFRYPSESKEWLCEVLGIALPPSLSIASRNSSLKHRSYRGTVSRTRIQGRD